MTIGKRIKQLRKESGKTQEEFAQKLLISGKAVSKLEKGINKPPNQTITLICREFGVSEE
ncbi:MAG: helix-turn-helix transcriptional regulator [Oscillibacter sp.]|nr:helix-turn-helix transcriptional regulator [Oscillibacter sp.]